MLKKTRLMALTSLGLFLGYCALQAHNHHSNENDLAAEQRSSTTTTTTITTQPANDQQDPVVKNDQLDMKKLSEAFGHFIGRNLQSPGLSFDLDSIIKGIREGAAGQPAPLTEKEYEEMMTAVQEKAFKEMSSSNLKSANDFMDKNKQASDVSEIIPGKLQYLILKEGSGPTVDSHSSPKIHYSGKYQDGTVFGTSEEMGGPITIPLDQTIPGFSKGITGMKEGEKRRLFVHPDLGYGTAGQLPPNELLIFDIEVVKANSDEGKEKGSHGDQEDFSEDFLLEDEETPAGEATHQEKPAIPSVTAPQTQTPAASSAR